MGGDGKSQRKACSILEVTLHNSISKHEQIFQLVGLRSEHRAATTQVSKRKAAACRATCPGGDIPHLYLYLNGGGIVCCKFSCNVSQLAVSPHLYR